MKYGDRVKILGGMQEFVGATGTVRETERDGRTKLYRVRLDEPVAVPSVGRVTSDLWAREFLKRIK
jgi:hypothetical protein